MADPPSRAKDERPFADRRIGDTSAACIPNESNCLHYRY